MCSLKEGPNRESAFCPMIDILALIVGGGTFSKLLGTQKPLLHRLWSQTIRANEEALDPRMPMSQTPNGTCGRTFSRSMQNSARILGCSTYGRPELVSKALHPEASEFHSDSILGYGNGSKPRYPGEQKAFQKDNSGVGTIPMAP